MDYTLYEAIKSGNMHQFNQIVGEDNSILSQMNTHLNNNSLHVAVQYNQEACVREICKRCPSLVLEQNFEGNTPLHIGARLALPDIVRVLLNCANRKIQRNEEDDIEEGLGRESIQSCTNDTSEEEMEHSPSLSITKLQQLVRMVNKKKDTAFHEAMREASGTVLGYLLSADRSYEYFANNAGETPLYLAARYGHYGIVDMMPCPTYAAPDGRTVLHTAIMNPGCPAKMKVTLLDVLLKKMPQIVKEVDKDGRSALHYVAINGNAELAIKLLDFDPSVGYIQDKDGMTALHYAARGISNYDLPPQEVNDFIENVIKRCPDCWELVDNEGRNFLHVAAKNKRLKVIKYVFGKKSNYMVNNLISKRDNYGNTPLSLLVLKGEQYFRCALTRECIEIFMNDSRVKATANYFACWNEIDPQADYNRVRNYLNETREELSKREEEETKRREKEIEKLENLSQNHVLVATLIATVAFAAGFTLPGGYKDDGSDVGMATLAKKAAFIAFMVFDSLAMLLSIYAVFLHFWSKFLSTSLSREYDLISVVRPTLACTFFAILAMVAAFISGTYTVLSNLPALAIPLCLLGCSFFVLCAVFLRNTYSRLESDGQGPFIKFVISKLFIFDVFRSYTN
ncbi:hypothetical protein MKW94_016509 [Papaver nudicaule]|uniref:PGG domain-containing protein n=1 Tax=Papaver nudicaule TaxID=74823 RepID=A0AA41SHV4_PAPNU|nr:hypothetical protein [Papaver nudicaule]